MQQAALARWTCPRVRAWSTSRSSSCRSGLLSSARIERERRRESVLRSTSDAAAASTPSTSTSLSCRHFSDCSGCSLADDLAAPPAFQEAAGWFRSQGVEIEKREEVEAHGWRCRARLAVRRNPEEGGKTSAVDVGLFRSGTHSVSPISDCVAHHPRINEAVEVIKRATEKLETRIYDEAKHARGGLRYLQLTAVSAGIDSESGTTPVHEDLSAQIQLVLVWGSDGSKQPAARGEAERLARLLWEEGGGEEEDGKTTTLFHSIFLNWQPSPGNSVMGPSYEHFSGPELAWQRIAVEVGSKEEGEDEEEEDEEEKQTTSVAVALSPAAFSQANPAAFGSLVGELARVWSISGGGDEGGSGPISALADLHAGAGAVGLSLAAAAAAAKVPSSSSSSTSSPPPLASLERVIAVDCVGSGRAPLAAAAARLRQERSASKEISVEFFEARAGEDPARWLSGVDAAVVDPPRKGLSIGDPELLKVLCEAPPSSLRRFAYISCHFPSLRRDAERLLGGSEEESGNEEKERRPFWRLSHGAARIFFPGADHVECLAVFERVD